MRNPVPPRKKSQLPALSPDFREVANPKQRAFLAAYVRTKEIRRGARAAGVGRQSHYLWMRTDAAYRDFFALAEALAADDAEEEIHRRAAAARPPGEEPDDFRDFFPEVAYYRQRAFLVGYLNAGTVAGARRFSGVGKETHRGWLERDPLYRDYFERAKMIAADALEEELYRRAFKGVDTPIVYAGEIKGWYKTYSDALAMLLLRRLKPEVYGDAGAAPPERPRLVVTIRHEERRRIALPSAGLYDRPGFDPASRRV